MKHRFTFSTHFRIRPLVSAFIATLAISTSQASTNKETPPTPPKKPTKTFHNPERIRYDGDCMQIEGKDVFIYSAAFHYFRTPKELWRDRLTKIKTAGFNTIETYVPWNIHELNMPKNIDDYSQINTKDLEEFLDMVHNEFDMYSIVRPGPFICAEWAGGAYPRWLPKFMPDMSQPNMPRFWLRSGDQKHIDWSLHWYHAISPVFAKKQITRMKPGKKGIILVQIENEYNHSGAKNKKKVLQALYKAVEDAGVNVPIFTCLTNECRGSSDPILSNTFDSDNYYIGYRSAGDCAHRMLTLKLKQPDSPGMVTELQGGWFSTVGGSLSEDHYSNAQHFQAIEIMSLLGGATILNPYMFVGGTHFSGWGARGMTTSYDYNAAIRECGAVGDKYLAAKGIGQFIRENEKNLVRAHGGPCKIQGAPKEVTGGLRQAPDGTRFVFFHNAGKTHVKGDLTVIPNQSASLKKAVYNIDQNGHKVRVDVKADQKASDLKPFTVQCDLGAMDSKILVIPPGKNAKQGIWYPKPQEKIKRPSSLPQPVRIAKVLSHEDPEKGQWRDWKSGTSLPELGVNDSRYVRYKSTFTLTEKEAQSLNHLLINSFSRDIINAVVNNQPAKRLAPNKQIADRAGRNTKTSWTRITDKDFDNQFDLTGLLKKGKNTIQLVYENIGHEHGYVPMEELSGINHAGLSPDQKSIIKPLPWKIDLNLGGIEAKWTHPDFKPNDEWKTVNLDTTCQLKHKGNNIQPKNDSQTGLLTWYRIEFNLPEKPEHTWIPWLLRINASGNGYMWLNGHNIGRHYETGPQRDWYLPECWLHFGSKKKNVIMLGLRQTSHGATIQAAEIRPYSNSAEVRKK